MRLERAILMSIFAAATTSVACSRPDPPAPSRASPPAVNDAQHRGITEPHGDHRPMHGGMVLMSGDLHYEVVFDRSGRHHVWFTDAVRMELPASVASDVQMVVVRPGTPPERVELEIDETGESWVAHGRAVDGENVIVTVSYSVQGKPYEIELPFFIPAP